MPTEEQQEPVKATRVYVAPPTGRVWRSHDEDLSEEEDDLLPPDDDTLEERLDQAPRPV